MRARGLALGVLGAALLGLVVGATVEPQSADVERGRVLFTEQGCHGCHTIGVAGTAIATDLSRVGARYTERALRGWLRDPARQKPGAHMPLLGLAEPDIQALAAYLASLR